MEQDIEDLESKIAEVEKQLADPAIYENPEEYEKLNITYNQNKQELEALMEKWEGLA